MKPPLGEGGVHRVNPKDLRPALDWSMVDGWTVPLSKVSFMAGFASKYILLINIVVGRWVILDQFWVSLLNLMDSYN